MTQKSKKIRSRLLTCGRIIFGVLLLTLLIIISDPEKIKEHIYDVNFALLALAFLIYVASMAVVALRWHILLKTQHIHISILKLVRYYFIGFFFNNFLPSSIGGDVTRIYNLARQGVDISHSFSCVFVERLIGFLAMAFLALVSIMAVGSIFLDTPLIPLITIALTITFFAVTWIAFDARCATIVTYIIKRIPWNKFREFAENVYAAIHNYKNHSKALWTVAAISLLYQAILGVFVYIVAVAMGLDAPFWLLFALMQISSMVGIVPISIETVGTREWIFSLVLKNAGSQESLVIATLLIVRFLSIAGSAIGGIFVLTGDAPHSLSQMQRSEK
jgi:glycosyltransferase 2 family protein